MSFTTASASASYITKTDGTKAYTFAGRADVTGPVNMVNSTRDASGFYVSSTTVGGTILPSIQMRHPGVFTEGTAPEGTASKPTNQPTA